MKEFIKKTGISTLKAGDKLNADIINTFNDRINKLITVVNKSLGNFCDLNLEAEDFEATFTLEEAVAESPRRSLGMKIRFLNGESNKYEEYSYTGTSCDDTDWLNMNNWVWGDSSIIDGGIWDINNEN